MGIKFVVDSASEITQEEAKKMGIYCLPLTVAFGDEIFRDGIDINNEEFYNKLVTCKELPKTSQVTPFLYEEAFREIISEGHTPIAITLSSKVSGTYNSAVLASKQFNEDIYIIDTLNGSIGIKIFVEFALSLLEKYSNPNDIVKILEEKKEKLQIFYLLDTLEYLYKGGRLSRFSALAGTMLSVKPIVTLVNGKVELAGKARGFKKGNTMLTDIIKKKGEIDQDMPFMLTYSGNDPTIIDQYKPKCRELFDIDPDKIPITNLGSTIGTHMGPGTIGVAFFLK